MPSYAPENPRPVRPWKREGNMISNLIENLGKPNDTAIYCLPSFLWRQAVSSDFPRFPTRLVIKFPTGFHGCKSKKPRYFIKHSAAHIAMIVI